MYCTSLGLYYLVQKQPFLGSVGNTCTPGEQTYCERHSRQRARTSTNCRSPRDRMTGKGSLQSNSNSSVSHASGLIVALNQCSFIISGCHLHHKYSNKRYDSSTSKFLARGVQRFFFLANGYNRSVAWFVGRTVKITVQSLTGYIQIHNLQMWLRAAGWTPMV
jgi:hypothetical protein